jgi:hypothetical protein
MRFRHWIARTSILGGADYGGKLGSISVVLTNGGVTKGSTEIKIPSGKGQE